MTSRSTETGCVFCTIARQQFVAENRLAYGVRDISPVTSLHTLILHHRHVASYFDLTAEEKRAIDDLSTRSGGSTSASMSARPPARRSSIATFI